MTCLSKALICVNGQYCTAAPFRVARDTPGQGPDTVYIVEADTRQPPQTWSEALATAKSNCAHHPPKAIPAGLRAYREKTQPLLDLLREKELIVLVDGTPPPDVVQAEIRRTLGLGSVEAEASAASRAVEVAR